MKKTYETKVMKSDEIETKTTKKSVPKRTFRFRHENRVIEARNLAEATKKLSEKKNES